MNRELSTVARKQDELEDRLMEVAGDSGHGMIGLNAKLVKKPRTDKMSNSVIEQ